MKPCELFGGSSSRYLADDVADFYGQTLGKMQVQKFADGEFHLSIEARLIRVCQRTIVLCDRNRLRSGAEQFRAN